MPIAVVAWAEDVLNKEKYFVAIFDEPIKNIYLFLDWYCWLLRKRSLYLVVLVDINCRLKLAYLLNCVVHLQPDTAKSAYNVCKELTKWQDSEKTLHFRILDVKKCQGDWLDTCPNERVFVVEKHNCLVVQGECLKFVVEEKVYGLASELDRETFKKIHIVIN